MLFDGRQLSALLERAQLAPARIVAPLPGGGNNRLFRVETARDEQVVLKAYFHHPDDPRDRLGAEFTFSHFAWSAGVHNIPRPLAADRPSHLGLYEFVAGRRPVPDEIGRTAVAEAVDFIKQLNQARELAAGLADASEADFSLAQHVQRVDGRVARLDGIESPDARELVSEVIQPMWREVRRAVFEEAGQDAISTRDTLRTQDRCVSPSDFGFHNTLLDNARKFWFLDFEYAGWDDPAKLVCDFFCQPAVPVPIELFDSVARQLTSAFTEPDWHFRRIHLLWPVFQIKWACILLNEFLPIGSHRRLFAGLQPSNSGDNEQRLERSRGLAIRAAQAAESTKVWK